MPEAICRLPNCPAAFIRNGGDWINHIFCPLHELEYALNLSAGGTRFRIPNNEMPEDDQLNEEDINNIFLLYAQNDESLEA